MNISFYVATFLCILDYVCGYIIYCPCMGRFGNQADQFLGTLRFAKRINRTLVLPPFIEYVNGVELYFRPFNDLFKLSVLKTYHRVITMEEFMSQLSPSVWPRGQRKVFCYTRDENEKKVYCRTKEGRPFKNFWDYFNVDFDENLSLGSLDKSDTQSVWDARFPPALHPVLAFGGAMGSFPIKKESTLLHRYLRWNVSLSSEVHQLINARLPRPYVAIHLRNDRDFDNVCDMVNEKSKNAIFDSAQCHGYSASTGVTRAQCLPPVELVVAHTRQMMELVGAKTLFVATDRLDLAETFRKELGASLEAFESTNSLNTHFRFDLALLGRADGAVLNCVSSFSAFARRERDVRGLKTEYFGFTPLRKTEL